MDFVGKGGEVGLGDDGARGCGVVDRVGDGRGWLEELSITLVSTLCSIFVRKRTESSTLRGIRTSMNESMIVVGRPVVMLSPLSKQKSVQKTLLRVSASTVSRPRGVISLCMPSARAIRYATPIML